MPFDGFLGLACATTKIAIFPSQPLMISFKLDISFLIAVSSLTLFAPILPDRVSIIISLSSGSSTP